MFHQVRMLARSKQSCSPANPNYSRSLVTIPWTILDTIIALRSRLICAMPTDCGHHRSLEHDSTRIFIKTLYPTSRRFSLPPLPPKKILPTIEILEYFRLDLRFATNRNSTLESRPNKKKKQEDDDNDDDDDDDGSRPTIHVNEKKKKKKGTIIKVKPGRAEMHGAFSSRATGDAVTSVNKQMDKRRGPPNWTLKEGARKRFERGHGFKARRPKRGCVLIRADR